MKNSRQKFPKINVPKLFFYWLPVLTIIVLSCETEPKYKNSKYSAEIRAKDLLKRMSLPEKIAQMQCIWHQKDVLILDSTGNFNSILAKKKFGNGNSIGQVGRPSDAGKGKNPEEMAQLTNQIQEFFIKNSRWGIPVFFHEECLHGHAAIGGTSFPQPIAMGCSFNTTLVQKVFSIVAEESRVRGTHLALTPVVDVAREPRWGRVEETYGEDPFLVSRMGLAVVNGFQGDRSYSDKKHIMATLKHYAAHAQPESGTNGAPANISERTLRETFLYPFKIAVQEGGVECIMASYNEIDGVPSHANSWLLRKVLREEWGFKGFVVSDYYAIRELFDRPDLYGHNVATSQKDAARLSAESGVNMELPDPDCFPYLEELVKEGKIKEETIDDLVFPLLVAKFRMGLFEDPYVEPAIAEEIVGSITHREVALQMARESIVLLKNQNNFLPLKPIKKIALVGPHIDRETLGGYSGNPYNYVTIKEGISKIADKKGIEIIYAEGCKITANTNWKKDEVLLNDPADDRRLIAEAVKKSKLADIIVIALGGNEQTSREAWHKNRKGDRASLDMVGLQDEMVNELAKLNKPIVAFLFNGRPLSVNNLVEKSTALFECFYLGQETGTAVAEVLFGEYNPGGKLSISIPRSVGHIPCYYNYKPSARRSYLFDETSPLFAFGYGLSYTTFSISTIKIEKPIILVGEETVVTALIENTGKIAGDEVVQLYIRDEFSSVTRPIKELKGFERLHLEPGEKKQVKFIIDSDKLAFYDINYHYLVEPGTFKLMIGNRSDDPNILSAILTVK